MLNKFFNEIQELERKGETVRVRTIDGRSYDGKISKTGEDYIEVSHEKGNHLIYFNNITSVSIIAKEVEWGSSIFEKIKRKKKN